MFVSRLNAQIILTAEPGEVWMPCRINQDLNLFGFFVHPGHAVGFALLVGKACMCHSDPSPASSAYFGLAYFWLAAQVTCLGKAALLAMAAALLGG